MKLKDQNRTNKTFRSDIRNSFFMTSIAIIIMFSALFYFFLYYVGGQIVKKQNHETNTAISLLLEDQVSNYSKFINELSIEDQVKQYLKFDQNEQDIYEELYQFVNQQQIRCIFYITNTKGDTLVTNSYTNSPYYDYEIFLSGIFKQMKKFPNQTVMMLNKIQLSTNTRTVYSIGKGIVQNGEVIGYVIFDLLESDFNQIIYDNQVDLLVITDEYKNAIISTNNIVLDRIGKFKPLIEEAHFTYSIRNEKHYIEENAIYGGKIKIYTLSSHAFLRELYMIGLISELLVAVIIILIVNVIAKKISIDKTRSIDQILVAIKSVQNGNLDTVVNIKSNDEFELIGVYFNKMLMNLKDVINKNSELINLNKAAEIKQLEAQFNPHFLYNALESLKYLIRFNPDEASKFVISLANLMRYSIEFENQFVTLEKDLDYVASYLQIQKLRFGQRLNYEIKMDTIAKLCEIPKLIIQPLVENCINHGYVKKEYLTILINVSVESEMLKLVIEDNGDGMTKEQQLLMQNLLDSNHNQTEHIGIFNVHRRIHLHYGKPYGLILSSKKNEGTKVTMMLPVKIREVKDDQNCNY